jgi:anti-anti-sigma regulatory factor
VRDEIVAVKKVETEKVNYVLYVKSSNADFETLKTILTGLTIGLKEKNAKDVVVDFYGAGSIAANELAFLLSTAKKLKDDNRKLVLLASAALIKLFENTKIHKIDNMIIQDNQWTQKAEEPPAPPAPVQASAPRSAEELVRRLVKITCPTCEYTVWTLEQYFHLGLPSCPFNHKMQRA